MNSLKQSSWQRYVFAGQDCSVMSWPKRGDLISVDGRYFFYDVMRTKSQPDNTPMILAVKRCINLFHGVLLL